MTFERRLKPRTTVDLTPLIDVVFQLVIFFMISSTFKTAPGIELALPGSTTATAVSVAELQVIAVSASEVYVGKVRTDAAGASAAIAADVAGRDPKNLKATLKAGASAPYQLVVGLLDALRANGVESVGLATEPPEPSP